jgi:hypothetical protein
MNLRRLPEFISGKKTPIKVFLQVVAQEKNSRLDVNPARGSPCAEAGRITRKILFSGASVALKTA